MKLTFVFTFLKIQIGIGYFYQTIFTFFIYIVIGNGFVDLAVETIYQSISNLDPLKLDEFYNDFNLTVSDSNSNKSKFLTEIQLAQIFMKNGTLHGLRNLKRTKKSKMNTNSSHYIFAFTIRCKNLSLTANTGVTIPLLSLFTKYNSFQAFMQTYVDVIEFEITLLMKSALAKPFVDKVDVKKFKDVHVQYDLSIPFLSFIIETTIRIVFFVFNDLVKSFIGKLITDMINDLLD